MRASWNDLRGFIQGVLRTREGAQWRRVTCGRARGDGPEEVDGRREGEGRTTPVHVRELGRAVRFPAESVAALDAFQAVSPTPAPRTARRSAGLMARRV